MLKCTHLSLSVHIYMCLPVIIYLLLGSSYTALPFCPHSSAALHGTPCPVFAFPTSQVLMCTHVTCENAAPASAGLGQGLEHLIFKKPPGAPCCWSETPDVYPAVGCLLPWPEGPFLLLSPTDNQANGIGDGMCLDTHASCQFIVTAPQVQVQSEHFLIHNFYPITDLK